MTLRMTSSSTSSARSMTLEVSVSVSAFLHELRNLRLPALLDEVAHVALHRGARGERLDAAALAAAAARAVRQERHVADLAGDAAAAVVRVVADDDAAADAGADEDADHGARALADAVGVLADDGDAHVVVEEDAHAERRRERSRERHSRPAEVGRGVDDAALVVDAAGDADAERADVGRARAELRPRCACTGRCMRSMTASAPSAGERSCSARSG